MIAMAASRPSNYDIFAEVLELKSDLRYVKEVSEETRALAKKTNGRVTELEYWRREQDAKDIVKSSKSTVTAKDILNLSLKALAVIGTALAIVLAVVQGFFNG